MWQLTWDAVGFGDGIKFDDGDESDMCARMSVRALSAFHRTRFLPSAPNGSTYRLATKHAFVLLYKKIFGVEIGSLRFNFYTSTA